MRRVFAIFPACAVLTAAASNPAGAEAPASAEPIPDRTLDRIVAMAAPPSGATDKAELLKAYAKRLRTAFAEARRIEDANPDAPNLHELRYLMVNMADILQRDVQDPAAHKDKLAVAKRLLSTESAPVDYRYAADVIVLEEKLGSMVPKDIRVALLQFMGRYLDTTREARAKTLAMVLAKDHKLPKLVDNLAKNLQAEHLDAAGVKATLRALGRHPDVGKAFEAELSLMNGKTRSLPGDERGHPVVVVFWATWMPATNALFDDVEAVRKAYGEKIAVVGVNLDAEKDRGEVRRQVREQNLRWIHAGAGKGFGDPVALKYGLFTKDASVITPLPCCFVLDAEGTIVSDDAWQGDKPQAALREVIDRALKGPAESDPPEEARESGNPGDNAEGKG